MFNMKSLGVALVFSVVIPMGFLATLRFTGLLSGPVQVSETITADTASWSVIRPPSSHLFRENVTTSCQSETLSASFKIHAFMQVGSDARYGGNDVLGFNMSAVSSTTSGHICSMSVKATKTDELAFLYLRGFWRDMTTLTNLELNGIADSSSEHEGFLVATGIDQPASCGLETRSHWVFHDNEPLNNITCVAHRLMITLEVVYSDGASYRQVNLPIELEIEPDDNDGRSMATLIQGGINYTGLCIGKCDQSDWYNISVPVAHSELYLRAKATPSDIEASVRFEIVLYDPHGIRRVHLGPGSDLDITYGCPISGTWTIEIRPDLTSFGYYYLCVELRDIGGCQRVPS